jgi:hypothetical protein
MYLIAMASTLTNASNTFRRLASGLSSVGPGIACTVVGTLTYSSVRSASAS